MKSVPLPMRREPPERLPPLPRSIVATVPLVQATLTLPDAVRSVLAFATTGSYAPKATGEVVMVQFAATDEVTFRLAVAEPANAGTETARAVRAMRERTVRFILLIS